MDGSEDTFPQEADIQSSVKCFYSQMLHDIRHVLVIDGEGSVTLSRCSCLLSKDIPTGRLMGGDKLTIWLFGFQDVFNSNVAG